MVQERARAWCWTIHKNHTKNGLKSGDKWDSLDEHAKFIKNEPIRGEKYICFQWEKGEETGTIHLQGYMSLNAPVSLKQAAKRLGGANLQMANGTAKENRSYCSKNESKYHVCEADARPAINFTSVGKTEGDAACGCFFERGDIDSIGSGMRTDLIRVAKLAETETIDKIMQEEPTTYMKYHRGIEKLVEGAQRRRAPTIRKLKVIVYWGDSGAGKTHKALEYDPTSWYKLDEREDKRIWWEGYNEERTVVIDEFRATKIKFGMLLSFLDPYKIRLNKMGHFTYGFYDTVIITSNYHPSTWYNNHIDNWEADDIAPLKRRIHEIYHVTGNFDNGTTKWDSEPPTRE